MAFTDPWIQSKNAPKLKMDLLSKSYQFIWLFSDDTSHIDIGYRGYTFRGRCQSKMWVQSDSNILFSIILLFIYNIDSLKTNLTWVTAPKNNNKNYFVYVVIYYVIFHALKTHYYGNSVNYTYFITKIRLPQITAHAVIFYTVYYRKNQSDDSQLRHYGRVPCPRDVKKI